MNKNYRRGYTFEKRVQKFLESIGYLVIRQGKSSFPDLIAIPTVNLADGMIVQGDGIFVTFKPKDEILFVECKNWKKVPSNPIKQLSDKEYFAFEDLYINIPPNVPHICFLAYNLKVKNKSNIVFYDLFGEIIP